MNVMPHRPPAGGMSDRGMTGLMAMLFALAVGLAGSNLSLLLLWPGFVSHGVKLHLVADGHIPLLLFFSAVPATLGGLAVSSIPGLVGSDRGAYQWLPTAGLGLTMIAFCMLTGGVLEAIPALTGAGVATLAIATVGTAAYLIATILSERTVSYSLLVPSVWTTLIAAVLAVCAAPIVAACSMVSLWHGVAVREISADMVWPALWVVLVLVIGLVSDILFVPTALAQSPSLLIVILSSGLVPAFYMTWTASVLHRSPIAPTSFALRLTTDTLVMPVEAIWLYVLLHKPVGRDLFCEPPALFAAGAAIILAIGLIKDAIGHSSHDTISLAVVFGLSAGFSNMTKGWIANRLMKAVMLIQFWCLLVGSVILLVPQLSGLRAVGAALLILAVLLFACSILKFIIWRFNDMTRGGRVRNLSPYLDNGRYS